MKIIKYFFQFIFICLFFLICKLLGYKKSSNFGAKFGEFFGPIFRSKKTISKNLKIALPQISSDEINNISKNMWKNYGRILAEYMYIKDFRNLKLKKFIKVENSNILENINRKNKPVIFISGHFNNFELLAMIIEMTGIDLAALYRPLNNLFLNEIMIKIRAKYICKNQIPKGISGVKSMVNSFKNGTSLAMMIDQRVSQGEKVSFFNSPALTTTIPAQFVKKYNCQIVPLYIERIDKYYFKVKVDKPFELNQNDSIEQISETLNRWLEKKILNNPNQWIWSHNRWK